MPWGIPVGRVAHSTDRRIVDLPLFDGKGQQSQKGSISTAWASISTEVWIEFYILVPDGPELGRSEQQAKQVCI